jgi:adenylate cyclase
VDPDGYFYLDWRLQSTDPRLSGKLIENVLLQNRQREAGQTNDLTAWAKNKLVVVGYAVEGNNLTDRGATPLENNTLLVSAHWNVANAVLNNRFIRRVPVAADLAIILLLGTLTAFLTWRLRALTAFLAVLGLVAGYAGLACFLFIQFQLWVPMLFPLAGAIFMQYASLTTIRVLFEEGEKRRVKSVFSKLVAPDVVNELLQLETLSMRGDRREVTVFFADVRGFTSLTDQMQEQVAEFVRQNNLTGTLAKECFDESAADTLLTVNRYLAKVADEVKRHQGTLDKYIGDCVMAFWNAPVPNPHHARDSVLTAIAAQRAINELNQTRLAENPAREALNAERLAAGRPPLPLHKPLQLGTGINTGSVVVGLMGSDEHVYNFTVFGREVNLASRLEGVSGSGRIIISEVTYAHLQLSDPALAARCLELPPVMLKGFREAVKIYEVPWQT